MSEFHTATGLGRRWGIAPRIISDLFYQRVFDDAICPVVDGRRIIPDDYVSTIESVLRERGALPTATETAARA